MAAQGQVAIPIAQLRILRHAIGYDDDGNDRYHGRSGNERRNHFVTHPDAHDWSACAALVAGGFMVDRGPSRMCGGDYVFTVTDKGREVVLASKPQPKKLTAGAQRYRDFLRADSGMKFGEWLKCMQVRKGVMQGW